MKFLSALTLIFITLKLTSVIAWSWWLVLLPAYGMLLLVLVLFVIVGISPFIWGFFRIFNKKGKK